MKSTSFFIRATLFSLLLIGSLTFASTRAHAGPALVLLQDYTQPTGEHFTATIKGDEWKNWIATAKNEVIIQGLDKFWYYVQISDNKVIASSIKYAIDPPPARIVTSQEIIDEVSGDAPSKQVSLRSATTDFSLSQSAAPILTSHNLTMPHKLLVILVSFNNKIIQNSEAAWSNEIFGATNSVNSYYKEVSNNQFYFLPAEETSGITDDGVIKITLSRAHPNTSNDTDVRNEQIVSDALSAANAKINFASFDKNLDGYVSMDELHIMTIIAGNEASHDDPAPTVWGHKSSLYYIVPPTLDNVTLVDPYHSGGYVQFGEMHGTHMATIGILCHELGHDLGLPDLYDTDSSSSGLGIHSLMASGSWGYTSSTEVGGSPSHFDAWSKMFLGFTTAPEATTSNLVDANAGDVYRVSTSNPAEYFLIENRQFNGYDAALAAYVLHGGIAIYHIDEGVISSTLGSNKVNNNDAHKGIKIIEANGKNQLDTRSEDWYDHYFAGSSLYKTFSDSTNPSSKFYDGTASNVSITAVSPSQNAMTVSVVGIAASPNASLRSIILSQGTVNPKFSGAVTSYKAIVTDTTTSLTVTPTVAVEGSTITVNGTPVTSGNASGAINLSLGLNNINIHVTSQGGTVSNDYVITVNRSQGVEATFITLSKRELNLTLTSPKTTLTAQFTPLTTTMKTVTWSTYDSNVATVSNTGVITVVGTGSTKIEAKSANGLTDAAIVNVTVPVTKVELNADESKVFLNVGDSDISLHAAVSPSGATNTKLIWTSSNTKSVTVGTYGSIHAIALGTAIITATSQVGGKSAKSTVTVPTKATAVTITPSTLTLKMGQAVFTMKAALTPTTATYKVLSWSSENTAIVTVDPITGKATTVSVGDTFIKVVTPEGITSKIPVKVIVPVKALILSPSVTTITYQGTLPMVPSFDPPDATIKDIIWTSSLPRVATVDSSGTVTGGHAGTTVITGKTVDGSKQASKTIAINGIALAADELFLNLNKPTSLKVTLFNTGTNRTLIWKSSDPTVAEVNTAGLVTPKLIGEVTITASTYDKMYSDTTKVTIIQTSLATFTIDPKAVTLKIGDTDLQLTPTIGPSDATIQKAIWTSSNTATATVDSSGFVHAVAAGTTIITATTLDGAKIAKVTITVPIPVASVRIVNTGPLTLKLNTTISLKSAITPATARDPKVTWGTNSFVAEVSTTGLVKGLAVGTATISVHTSDGGFKDNITVIVIIPNSTISFASTKETLKVGAADITLVPIFKQVDATDKSVTWNSSNPAVATVDSDGAVHAVSAGTATVTATTVEGAKSAKVIITVPNSVKSIKLLHPDVISINLKSALALKASVLPLTSTNLKVSWKSSDENVATVGAKTGAVKAGSILGSTIITATTEDGLITDTITVNVIKAITTFTVNKTSATLTVTGADLALGVKILPADVVDKAIIWESSNSAVATVDSNGLVHPVSVGKATITATSSDGAKVAKTAITVK
ncbi:M6 family metalloprotease domain-containing protein [Paenibacillus psychroresistens]|uniref:M6 family metalloprotease domain-containing protein n=1 Tax=Paenibacillus psychroresistens TaxID=1778678 RepID=A0A6B8RWI9_9BACL|nr:Ig-like domain-containing protein [Paenibacillus psychroresistens]QGQ99556.1 M6 family metalloprotease domain-containing protein [Paenibacillus psychroresistens]